MYDAAMLEGKLVVLRPPAETDFPLLQRLRNDVELAFTLLTLPRGTSLQQVKQWVDGLGADPRSLFFVVAAPNVAASREPFGFVQLTHVDTVHGTAELGICLEASARGHGRGKEALELLESYVQATFGLRKLVLHVLSDNARARRLYGQIGYREVGVLRAHFFNRGAHHDVMIMEKLLT